jgi:hypothetical protein
LNMSLSGFGIVSFSFHPIKSSIFWRLQICKNFLKLWKSYVL